MNGWALPPLPTRRGRKPRVPVTDLLAGPTFHVLSGAGTLAEHFGQLFDQPLADSSWADRRGRLPWEVFADLLRRVLRPRARPGEHREAFWRGWRRVAIDGTQFSLINTPQVTATRKKARTRRGRAAFAKITTAVLLELGLHNPLAAAIGRQGESEWALSDRLIVVAHRRELVPLADSRFQAVFLHQAHDPLSTDLLVLLDQILVDAGTPVALLAFRERRVHEHLQPAVVAGVGRFRSTAPGIEPARCHLQAPAQDRDGVVDLLHGNEPKPYRLCFAKKAVVYSTGRRNVMEDHATRAKTSTIRSSEGGAVGTVEARRIAE